jgi:membrane associated rhomboid family serine protease
VGGLLPIRDKTRPTRTPYVTYSLIIINVLAFLHQISSDYVAVIQRYAFYPILFLENEQQYRLVTSMFLHGDLLHLGGNMLFLYIFGDNVEGRLGRTKYLFAYISLGVAASVTHTVWVLYQEPQALTVPAIGASGAISGVLGAYAVLYPHSRIVTLLFLRFFIRIVEVPAYLYLGFWFVYQLILGSLSPGGGIAYWAHVGGFAVGALLGLMARLP